MADTLTLHVVVGTVLVGIEVAKNKVVASIFDLVKERDHRVKEYLKGLQPSHCQYFRFGPPVPIDAFKFSSSFEITNKEVTLETRTAEVVSPFAIVGELFPNEIPSGAVCLLVEVTHAFRTGKKQRLEVEDSNADRPGFKEAQALDVEMARLALAPSSAAAMPAFLKEQKRRPVLNGRPCNNYGPPVGLFHPIFDSFQAAMQEGDPDIKTYALVRKLFKASADIYETQAGRISAIDEHLDALLGEGFQTVEASGVKSDGVMTQASAYLVMREVKNEIGTASADPYNQGSFSYRKYWAEKKQNILRSKSYCPSFILAIAGPWLCVLGGVYADKAIVQPLTDYLWLGGDMFSDDRLLSISRLFTALKSAISTLRQYYLSLSDVAGDSPNGFPFVRNYRTETFSYMTQLAKDHPHKLIYKVRQDKSGKLLVVKFVSAYNAEAHLLLAEHNLAPALHYAGTEDAGARRYGGRYMIVMDFVDTTRVLDSLSENQTVQVRRVVGLLHSRNLVFGDLRRPNILIRAGKEDVMIVDFDWCGRADEGRYPASLNQEDGIDWPEGVGPNCVMRKQHDLDMLEKLPR